MDPKGGGQYPRVASATAAAGRARRGLTTEELEAIYRTEVSHVWSFLARLGVRAAWLEDLTHDVFAIALRRREEFDVARSARPWLLGIAYRVALDFRRLAMHRHETGAKAPDLPVAGDAEDGLHQRDAKRLVDAALDQLDLDRRTVLVMHDLQEIAIPDVAEALAIPLGTAYSRLRLGRRDFTRAVRALRGEEGRDE
jgi:RNA polymerase sigma-70 factor (ECF subfamily)